MRSIPRSAFSTSVTHSKNEFQMRKQRLTIIARWTSSSLVSDEDAAWRRWLGILSAFLSVPQDPMFAGKLKVSLGFSLV